MAEILGYEFEGIPAGPAMGAINGTNPQSIRDKLNDILRSPAGLATMGSFPNRYNEGNQGETYYHDPIQRKTLNAIGLASIGLPNALPLIQEFGPKFTDAGKVLIVGITALRGQEADAILPEMAEQAFEAGAHAVEVNYSCPNIVTAGGGRKPILGYDALTVETTRRAIIQRVGLDLPLQEKLPPFQGEHRVLIPQLTATYAPERRTGNVGATGFNTIPGMTLFKDNDAPALYIVADVDGEEVVTHEGGMSGPYVYADYNYIQDSFVSRLPSDVPFIRAGGVWSGGEVAKVMAMNPQVQAVTSVTRFLEAEKAGVSFGATARNMAIEYAEAA